MAIVIERIGQDTHKPVRIKNHNQICTIYMRFCSCNHKESQAVCFDVSYSLLAMKWIINLLRNCIKCEKIK